MTDGAKSLLNVSLTLGNPARRLRGILECPAHAGRKVFVHPGVGSEFAVRRDRRRQRETATAYRRHQPVMRLHPGPVAAMVLGEQYKIATIDRRLRCSQRPRRKFQPQIGVFGMQPGIDASARFHACSRPRRLSMTIVISRSPLATRANALSNSGVLSGARLPNQVSRSGTAADTRTACALALS